MLVTVVAGWFLQMVHVAVFGDHHDDTRWAVGLFMEAVLTAAAVGPAMLARRLKGRDRTFVSPDRRPGPG